MDFQEKKASTMYEWISVYERPAPFNYRVLYVEEGKVFDGCVNDFGIVGRGVKIKSLWPTYWMKFPSDKCKAWIPIGKNRNIPIGETILGRTYDGIFVMESFMFDDRPLSGLPGELVLLCRFLNTVITIDGLNDWMIAPQPPSADGTKKGIWGYREEKSI